VFLVKVPNNGVNEAWALGDARLGVRLVNDYKTRIGTAANQSQRGDLVSTPIRPTREHLALIIGSCRAAE
jgi:hypothetical protein